jgi:hypothetical protein
MIGMQKKKKEGNVKKSCSKTRKTANTDLVIMKLDTQPTVLMKILPKVAMHPSGKAVPNSTLCTGTQKSSLRQ